MANGNEQGGSAAQQRYQQLEQQFKQYVPEGDFQTFLLNPDAFKQKIAAAGGGAFAGGAQAFAQLSQGARDLRLMEGGLDAITSGGGLGTTFDRAGGAIDAASIFGPLKQQIDELTQENIRLGRAAVTRGAAQAKEFASESFAGTGLGRSGMAAGTFQRLGQETAGKLEETEMGALARGQAAKLAVDDRVAQLQFSEQLRERGMNEEDIRSATNFYRQMEYARFNMELAMAAQEPSFWEEWGPVFDIVGSIGGAVVGGLVGGPAGAVAGASAGGGIGDDPGWQAYHGG